MTSPARGLSRGTARGAEGEIPPVPDPHESRTVSPGRDIEGNGGREPNVGRAPPGEGGQTAAAHVDVAGRSRETGHRPESPWGSPTGTTAATAARSEFRAGGTAAPHQSVSAAGVHGGVRRWCGGPEREIVEQVA
jgi:hypothetical protein